MTIKGIEAKIIAKNSKIAEIEIEGQKINISREYLPSSLEVGQSTSLVFMNSKDADLGEKKLAKEILEEILNGE